MRVRVAASRRRAQSLTHSSSVAVISGAGGAGRRRSRTEGITQVFHLPASGSTWAVRGEIAKRMAKIRYMFLSLVLFQVGNQIAPLSLVLETEGHDVTGHELFGVLEPAVERRFVPGQFR